MSGDTDIWMAFFRTFGMLFMVLAVILAGLYLFRRLAGQRGVSPGRDLIQVLAVHHLSPKEKLMLVKVADQVILVGASPAGLSRITVLDPGVDLPDHPDPKAAVPFSNLLAAVLKKKA